MTRQQAQNFCEQKNGVLMLNCISHILKVEGMPPKIIYSKLPEVMQGAEYPINADNPEQLFNSICEANEKYFAESLQYIKKCISFD